MIKFSFDIEPIGKKSVRQGKSYRGRTVFYKDDKTADFIETLSWFIRRDIRAHEHKFKKFAKGVAVYAIFYVKKPKSVTRKYPFVKPDLDNIQKAVFDAVTSSDMVWHDDCQIVALHVEKSYAEKNPKIEIAFYDMEPRHGVKFPED